MMRDRFKINLISRDVEQDARRSTLIVAGVFTLCVGLLSAVGAGASYRAAITGVPVLNSVQQLFSFKELRRLVFADDGSTTTKSPEDQKRFNVLLLGIGGEGHEGPQLTDTIILASLDKEQHRLGLVSVPRDLAYPVSEGHYQKINSINAYEEKLAPGSGARNAADKIGKLLDAPVDRVVKVDFKGFASFIDALGGLDIEVEHTFSDSEFPTEDDGPDPYKWTTVNFKKGQEHMNGKRVLTYVRSRHGSNGEGSDFARSRRQQIVIQAVRNRLLSLGVLANPQKISELWTIVSNHIQTDLTAWDVISLLPQSAALADLKTNMRVMTDGPDGELVSKNVDGSFLLFPKDNDWKPVQELAADPFKDPKAAVAAVQKKQVVIDLRNGTFQTGLAARIAEKLRREGYEIHSTGNAKQRNFEKTVIYDLTNGQKADELIALKNALQANIAVTSDQRILFSNGQSEEIATSTANFYIILGSSSLTMEKTTQP